MDYEKLPSNVICNDRGTCIEFTGPWPIRIFFPWIWWMF